MTQGRAWRDAGSWIVRSLRPAPHPNPSRPERKARVRMTRIIAIVGDRARNLTRIPIPSTTSLLEWLRFVSCHWLRPRIEPGRAQRARSYEGRGHPAKPTAARRSWPRWSITGLPQGGRPRAGKRQPGAAGFGEASHDLLPVAGCGVLRTRSDRRDRLVSERTGRRVALRPPGIAARFAEASVRDAAVAARTKAHPHEPRATAFNVRKAARVGRACGTPAPSASSWRE